MIAPQDAPLMPAHPATPSPPTRPCQLQEGEVQRNRELIELLRAELSGLRADHDFLSLTGAHTHAHARTARDHHPNTPLAAL